MGISKKSIGKLLGGTVAALLISSSAIAETVEITYENTGTSATLDVRNGPDIRTGLFEVTIDGNTTFAATNSNDRHYLSTWSATVNTYDDVQNGAGKFNNRRNDKTKYSQAGYLFTLLDFSESLSATAAKYNALVNYVIWDIMGSVSSLNSRADRRVAKDLKSKAQQQSDFDWSNTMRVYTSNEPRLASRELLASVPPPIATPIPGALFLFGSMALGLFGIATRKRLTAQ
jgi:hypothetical protein